MHHSWRLSQCLFAQALQLTNWLLGPENKEEFCQFSNASTRGHFTSENSLTSLVRLLYP